ncbi:MFS transporter [Streptomyces sp. SBT349]|uniref:MFS transporter n=1 Tax=Streptomyces sp. SBT349 TaxID=1580539 RepID=UPI00066E0F90|nr:MFS transporter [Streptomyces sp. SBT349]
MPPETAVSPAHSALDPRRWKALIFIALAQLMVVLDATIVNIAMPSAQVDLGISDGNRQWIITAYALAFGGLLLFGGRVSDLWGRRRAFVIGLIGFALASALGGGAQNEAMMYASRALQGVFGALLAPAALSLLTVLFTDVKERAKAFGVFGAIAGAGAAVGLLLGGTLTEYLDWRWTFFVNIPFAAVAAIGALLYIREPRDAHGRPPLDVPGLLLGTLGLVALVYGFARAEQEDWTESVTVGMFVSSAVLLTLFVVVEARVKNPLLPLRVVTDRNRGGAYASLGLAIIAMFGLFLFLTYYLQIVRGYSPVETGLAFLPMVVGMIVGSTQIGALLVTRVPPRLLMVPGFLVASVGMLMLTQLSVDTSYTMLIMPATVLLGLGLGTSFMPAMSLATERVRPADAGVASAMVNVSQQVGGAIGTALLNTIAASATTSYFNDHVAGATDQQRLTFDSMVHGYSAAIWWGFFILLGSALLSGLMINSKGSDHGAVVAGGEGAEEGKHVPVMVH